MSKATVSDADSADRRRLPPLLRRAWYGLNQAFRRRLAHLELTPDQFTVLRTLTENGALTQRELTTHISSDPNTVASLINRMAAAGLVERRPHETDRRAYRLRLKPAGQRMFRAARAIALGLQNEVLAAVPSQRRAGFLADLTRLADACQTAVERPGRERKVLRPRRADEMLPR